MDIIEKNYLATWGLEPALLVLVNRLASSIILAMLSL